MMRGYIKCPYCRDGIFSIDKGENTEIFVDGKNEIHIGVTTKLNENERTVEVYHIPMQFCFKCGRKLKK